VTRKKVLHHHHHTVDPDDPREPHDKFRDLAKKIVNVPKSDIDEREKVWDRTRRNAGYRSTPKSNAKSDRAQNNSKDEP
jgi:hypothetical protein